MVRVYWRGGKADAGKLGVDGGGRVRREMVVSVERANLEIRRNFFVIRAANEWNTIPDNVKTQKSLNGFKNAYDACKKNNPIEGAARETIEQEPDPGLT